MSWIKNYPAVICGNNGNNVNISNVEIFKNNEWIEIEPVNIARGVHSSITFYKSVYVIGGGKFSPDKKQWTENSIEKYSNDAWELLQVKLINPCYFNLLVCFNNNIAIIGGYNLDKDKRNNSVYFLDTFKLEIDLVNEITEADSFH